MPKLFQVYKAIGKEMPSSVIKHMDYKAETHLLKITFQTGAVYRYFEVPETVYVGLRQARSKGRYFNKYISGVFSFERVSS